MRIVHIHIQGFGIYHNFELRDFSPGLNVLVGPNEAGKTTLMAFIRSVLFGFADRRGSDNRYEPLNGGRHGGTLILEDRQGRCYTVERSPGAAAGRLRLYLPDHTVVGKTVLTGILGGISKTLYKNVFAFGLGELQRLETLQNSEVSGYIYSAGMGAGAISLVEVENKLQVQVDKLYKSGGKRPKINVLLKKLDCIEAKIQGMKDIPQEYFRLQKELQAVEKLLARNRCRKKEVQELIARTEKAVRGREFYVRLFQLRDALSGLPEIESFPISGMKRWEVLAERKAELAAAIDEKKLRLQELENLLSGLYYNQSLLQQAVEIEVLSEERALFIEQCKNLADLQLNYKIITAETERCMKLLGPDWSEERIQEFNCSVIVREKVRSYREDFQMLRARVKEACFRLSEVQRQKEKYLLERDVALRTVRECRVPPPPTSETVEARERALAYWQSAQIHLEHLEQDLQHYAERQGDILEQRERLIKEREHVWHNLPGFLAVFLFLAGSVTIIYLYLQDQLMSIPPVVVPLLVVISVLYLYARKNRAQQKAWDEEISLLQDKLTDLDRQCASLQAEIAHRQREMQVWAVTFLGKKNPEPEDVEVAARNMEKEKEALFQKNLLHKSLAVKEEELKRCVELEDRCARDISMAEEDLAAARAGWQKYLASLGTKREMSPEGLEDFIRIMEMTQTTLEKKQRHVDSLKEAEQDKEKYITRVNLILAACGFSETGGENAAAAALQLKENLAADRQTWEMQKSFRQERNVLQQEIVKLDLRVKKIEQEQNELLVMGGAKDIEEFAKRAAWYEERNKIRSEIAEMKNSLQVIAGTKEEKMVELMADLKNLDEAETNELLFKLQQEDSDLDSKFSSIVDSKGRLAQRINDLENSNELAELMLLRETLRSELSELTREWAVNSICQKLLGLAREKYERERQPAVLKKASGYFHTFTGGKYQRVLVPLGENQPEVEKDNLTRLKTVELSRGTAEQLYLAMRFALVQEYADRVISLPVIMDDILVNFDPERLQAAVEAIGGLAREHQVLFFTCHPHIARLLAGQNPTAKYINLEISS